VIIKSFSLENYRSITKSEKLPFYDLSILIGPNNEGKSNILHALVLVLQTITSRDFALYNSYFQSHRFKLNPRMRYHSRESFSYKWKRDFPLKLQETMPRGTSNFKVELELSKKEKSLFLKSTKIDLKGNAIVSISMSGDNQFRAKVYDSMGREKYILNEKIWDFISKRISIQYISAIRTSETTRKIVEDMIERELEVLKNKKGYKRLLDKVNKIEKPVLKILSKSLSKSIAVFLPDIKKIEIDAEERFRSIVRTDCNIFVDDGTKTTLDLKGDGIKSILAISIIQHVAQQKALGKNIILAIEEPESHLHPLAIHKFRNVLEEISKNNQVIITTHSPLLINRAALKKNLLVNKSNAVVAKNISEIRDILGVQISDNLISANLVILVEGEEDVEILKTWACLFSKRIKNAIDCGVIIFDSLGGSSNLSYKITQWKSLLCDVFVFLDNDMSGRDAYEVAEKKGLVSDKEAFFANIIGMRESEIEDMINIKTYDKKIYTEYAVRLEGIFFRNDKKKWSERIKDVFHHSSKRWSDPLEARIKKIVSEEVSVLGLDSLKRVCMPSIKTFVVTIEGYLALKNK